MCTWKECNNVQVHEWKDQDGKVWAHLCFSHNVELTHKIEDYKRSSSSSAMKRMLAAYVRAQGGAKVIAAKMTEEMRPALRAVMDMFFKKKQP